MLATKQLAQLAADNLDGANWYNQAAAEIQTVCSLANWNVERFTAILAVTSPRVAVARNVRITLHYMQTGELFSNVMRGIRRSVEVYETSGDILGAKTMPFYRALLGDASAIVLDVHMANLFNVSQRLLTRKDIKAKCQNAVKRVARRLCISPRDCQAALWTGQVRSVGRNPGRINLLQEYANQQAYGRFPATGSIKQYACNDGCVQSSLFAEKSNVA